jgi:hypothetical protein
MYLSIFQREMYSALVQLERAFWKISNPPPFLRCSVKNIINGEIIQPIINKELNDDYCTYTNKSLKSIGDKLSVFKIISKVNEIGFKTLWTARGLYPKRIQPYHFQPIFMSWTVHQLFFTFASPLITNPLNSANFCMHFRILLLTSASFWMYFR